MYEEPLTRKIYAAFVRQPFLYDLKLVIVWLAAGIGAIYLPVISETPVRVALALPVILFIPGYCMILALFPGEGDIDLTERIVLSICVSIAIVPIIGLGLNFTPWGIRLDPIVTALTAFTLVIACVAHYQRAMLPLEEQFRMPFLGLAETIKKEILPAGPHRLDRFLGIVLTVAIIITLLTTIYIVTVPRGGEQFTDFFILGENQTAADYPRTIYTNHTYPMYVGVENHEDRKITYTIETWMMLTHFDNLTSTYRIDAMDPQDRLSLSLYPNQTAIIPYNLSVNKTGYNRMEFLLFNENVPGFDVVAMNRINASYRNLHIWLNIGEGQYAEDQVDIPA